MQTSSLTTEEIRLIMKHRESRQAEENLVEENPGDRRNLPTRTAGTHIPSSPAFPSSSPPSSRGSSSRGRARVARGDQIDPTLRPRTDQRLNAIDERLKSLEDHCAHADADDEGDRPRVAGKSKLKGKGKGKRGKSAANKILSVNLDELSMEEVQTRHTLFVRSSMPLST